MSTTNVNIKKLNRFHMRVIMDYCGYPLNSQPKKTSDARLLAEKIYEANQEKFCQAYDWAVNRDDGKGGGSTTPMEMSELAREIVKEANEIQTNVVHQKHDEWATDFCHGMATLLADGKAKWKEDTEAAIKEASKKFVTHQIKSGPKKAAKKIKGIVHEKFERMIQLAHRRKNIMLTGPSGCGKTHVAAQIADALGLEYASQSCSAGVSESVFTGWLLPIEKGGTFQYVPSTFITAYETGQLFLIDEMDNGDENVLAFLNQALANDHFFLPQRFDKPLVKKHKNFVCIGAMNTMGTGADAMYTARNALDAATLDRFRLGFIEMDYSEAVESQLVGSEVLEWGLAVRRAISKKGLPKIMSTRVLLDATEMFEEEEWTIDDIEEGYFADWSPEEKRIIEGEMA